MKTGTVIDELMDGVERGVVTTFFGFPGSGKTTICLQIASSVLESGKVVYIDTESGFSPVRLKQMYNKDTSNLLVFSPESWTDQKSSLKKAAEIKPSLIIVDSVISLFRLEDLDSKELARYFRDMTKTARDLNIPIIATNQAYEWDGKTGMVSRTISEYWSKAVVYIEKTDRSGVRKMILKKHRWLPEGRTIDVEIAQEGFKKTKRFGIL